MIYKADNETSDIIRKSSSQIFDFSVFSEKHTPFPNNVFLDLMTDFRFMRHDGWFDIEENYIAFKKFLEAISCPYIFVTTPPYDKYSPLKLPSKLDYKSFKNALGAGFQIDEPDTPLLSATVLMFDESKKWAICHDVTMDINYIGLSSDATKYWDKAFDNITLKTRAFIELQDRTAGDFAFNENAKINLIKNYPE